MFKKSFIAGLLLLSFVAIPLSSSAQTPAVTNGLNWLSSNQTVDGNWPGIATEEFVATTTAAEALFLLNPAVPGYGQGVQWLEGHPASPTDLLARRIVTLARVGRNTATDVAQLLALRDAGGGWGGDDGYRCNTLDTALALQALKATNYPDQSLIFTTLNYLISTQKPDGGWGFTAESDSNVHVTAFILATFAQYQNTFDLQTPISTGASFLLGKQKSDGGFGANTSTVYETALAFIALLANEQTQGLAQAITYLTAAQVANGSWNDDPYATALALRALGEVKPDLALTNADLSAAPTTPLAETSLTVTARLRNRGLATASNAVARLYDGSTLLAEQPLVDLAPGAEISLDFPLTALAPAGEHTLALVLDPSTASSELRSDNNRAELRAHWRLSFISASLFSPGTLCAYAVHRNVSAEPVTVPAWKCITGSRGSSACAGIFRGSGQSFTNII